MALSSFRRACDCGRGAAFFSVARGKVGPRPSCAHRTPPSTHRHPSGAADAVGPGGGAVLRRWRRASTSTATTGAPWSCSASPTRCPQHTPGRARSHHPLPPPPLPAILLAAPPARQGAADTQASEAIRCLRLLIGRLRGVGPGAGGCSTRCRGYCGRGWSSCGSPSRSRSRTSWPSTRCGRPPSAPAASSAPRRLPPPPPSMHRLLRLVSGAAVQNHQRPFLLPGFQAAAAMAGVLPRRAAMAGVLPRRAVGLRADGGCAAAVRSRTTG